MNSPITKSSVDIIKSSMNDIENSTKGEMYLFVVAIDQYQKEKNLNHCKQEATEFIEIFHRHTQVKSKNIYTLSITRRRRETS